MKIHSGARARQVPPYNGIHEAFGPALWHRLFEARHDPSPEEFVNVPDTERELMMYAKSFSQAMCVVTGRRGVGKTSILRYVHDQWDKLKTCKVIYEDFRQETFATPTEYYTKPWDAETRRNFWMTLADEHISRILINNCKPLDVDDESETAAFVAFLQRYFIPAAPTSAAAASAQKLNRHLERIQCNYFFRKLRDPQFRYERLLFAFRLHAEQRRHVKLIIDNVDDKHRGFLDGLLEKLSHLQYSLNRIVVNNTDKVILTPFIALRPITFKVLQSNPQANGKGWNAVKEIVISHPASLSAIINNRYMALRRLSDFGDLSPSEVDVYRILQSRVAIPISDRQVTWQLPGRDHFILRTLELIADAKQDDELVDMANQDMSDAIPAMGDVLRNRHFISEDDVIRVIRGANASEIQKIAAEAVTGVTVVRCLAYGNQGINTPRYPVEDSRVANILHGRHSDCRLTMAKGRVIQALIKANQDDRVGIHMSELCDLISTWCEFHVDRVRPLLDEMWMQGLLECDLSGERPSKTSSEDVVLSCTPRAARLLQHIQNDSILLLCYRDEIDLAEDVQWPSARPSWVVTAPWQNRLSMEIRDKKVELAECAKIIQQVFCVEAAELLKTKARVGPGSRRSFSEWFGGLLISEVLLEGLRKSFNRYYQNFSAVDKTRWTGYFEESRSYMESWRQLTLDN